jgi:thiol-disulfide isomerase/thioredoxin
MSMVGRRAVLAGAAASFMATLAAAAPKVGQPAPPFTAVTFDMKTIALADLRGKVVVLNYWATWCAPCRVEIPMMDAYVRKHSADLVIFAIATENSVPGYKLRPLADALSFPLIKRLVGRGYGTIGQSVPTNYVIDRTGVLRLAKAGAFDEAGFDALIGPLIAEPPPPAVV